MIGPPIHSHRWQNFTEQTLEPEILVPVHGEMRHMREQARVGKKSGIPANIVQKNGDIVRLAPGEPGTIAQIEAGRLVLDGDIITPANGDSVTTRRRLSMEGLVIVVLARGVSPVVEAIGLPLDEDLSEFVAEAQQDILAAIGKLRGRDATDPVAVQEAARLAARRAARRWSGKNPQVRVIMPGLTQAE